MEREKLGGQRNDGENNCNSGDGTGQMAQPWMFMMIEAIVKVKFTLWPALRAQREKRSIALHFLIL